MSIIVTRDTLDTLAEHNHVFRINPDGTLDDVEGIWAPERVEDDLIDERKPSESEWEFVNGFSGQYGYSGPVMHASESLGGRMADHVLETPGIYVVTEAFVSQEKSGLRDDEYNENDPAGWVLLYRTGSGD